MTSPAPFHFALEHADRTTRARAGRWQTPHGTIDTPAFMPVGTIGSVKGLTPDQLRQAGVQIMLANTYHLALRPGPEIVADLGGLHRFVGWDGPMLTDSGGFQVFSLRQAEPARRRAGRVSVARGRCPSRALPRTGGPHPGTTGSRLHHVPRRMPGTRCSERCASARPSIARRAGPPVAATPSGGTDQALFGIVQGGTSRELRERSVAGLLPLAFAGYAVGGLSVGEAPALMYETLDWTVPLLPADRPRYLMGVGRPIDLVEAVIRGIDLFDCVLPTRNGRNATGFSHEGILPAAQPEVPAG